MAGHLSEDEEFELLSLERERATTQSTPQPSATVPPATPNAGVGDYLNAAKSAATLPFDAAKGLQQYVGANPVEAFKRGGMALPIMGAALAGPAAPIGGALGEVAREAIGTAVAPETVPRTPAGIFGSVVGQGVAAEPKILEAIPGVSKVGDLISGLASKFGRGAAKFEEAMTGAKAKDLEQAANQGLSTYVAPSMANAKKIFGQAAAEAGVPARPPLNQIIDPQLATARAISIDIGDKLEKGSDISPAEALQARQAVDRIYNATPLLDRSTRGHLADLRSSFDDVIANKSGALANASKLYRQAVVKSNILNPFRITKQGQMSAVAPMVATLAASVGAGTGHKEGAGIGGLGYLAASSPALAGLLATSGGSAANAFGALASRPEIRQALLSTLQQIMQSKNSQPQ